MSESRFYHIARAAKPTRLATLEEALAAARGGGFLWLDYCQPTREELTRLIEALGLHPLAIEDCLDERQVPKLSDFPGNTFLLLNTFCYADRALHVAEVDVFIGEHFLVTVGGAAGNDEPLANDVLPLAEMRWETVRQGPAYLLHVVLDAIVDRKLAAIEAIEEELDGAEEPILADPGRFRPAELLRLRRDLLALRKSLFHEREVLARICRRDCPFIPDKAIVYYRDIYDHLMKFYELAESCREVVTSLMEMYLSLLNNEMTRLANQTNRTVRRLTLISTIFMPLTLVAGILGMSEWTMMTGPANWRTAYPVFFLAMATLGAVNYVLLRWLEHRD
jgi:magnesium transporter